MSIYITEDSLAHFLYEVILRTHSSNLYMLVHLPYPPPPPIAIPSPPPNIPSPWLISIHSQKHHLSSIYIGFLHSSLSLKLLFQAYPPPPPPITHSLNPYWLTLMYNLQILHLFIHRTWISPFPNPISIFFLPSSS